MLYPTTKSYKYVNENAIIDLYLSDILFEITQFHVLFRKINLLKFSERINLIKL